MSVNGTSSRERPARRWTVFLDRDGTIVVDQVHGSDIARLELRPGARDALRLWHEAGWRVVMVTNQSGIARGKYTEAQMHAFHAAIEKATGVAFEAVYFCPHMPDAGCDCRKPRPGMLLSAIRDLGVEPARAFIVGDSEADTGAGSAVGVRSVYVASRDLPPPKADHAARDLHEAARWTLDVARKERRER